MSIAISEEHRALAQTVAGFLTDHQSRAAARALLTAEADPLPAFWAELASLGLLGLHVSEEFGGWASGYRKHWSSPSRWAGSWHRDRSSRP